LKFMYMDESGKGFMNSSHQNFFIFGGLILDKDKVYDALSDYKQIFQKHRKELQTRVNQGIPFVKGSEEKSNRIHNMFSKFELHAADIFNPGLDDKRGNIIVKENPWKYYPDSNRLELVNEVFKTIGPYIDKIYMFKIERQDFIDFCNKVINIKPTDQAAYRFLIPFVLEEFDLWLTSNNKTGAFIPDKLDASIREKFVIALRDHSSDNLWAEPITVESYTNAFTQIIDLITYSFYIVHSNAQHKANFNAIRKAYNKHISKFVEIKDLVPNLKKEYGI